MSNEGMNAAPWANDLDRFFVYHPPQSDQIPAFNAIRLAARELAQVIYSFTPACPDQTAAIRKVREAVMTANAAIACYGNLREED